ncbi:MAG: tRNA pseudouridine(55) synthase TruB [Balneolia bacterium]|nr:tRNA pseudouridine(55) synthase TruB [Balneolia bacterium]
MNSSKKTPLPVSTFPLFTSESSETDILNQDFSTGAVFLIDKPKDWSSFRPVGLLRKLVSIKKVGHAGTLDPMATGLLILCTGKATKSISLLQDSKKEYVAGIQFGSSTLSYDAETEVDERSDFSQLSADLITDELSRSFSGEISQLPPMYSALKVKGERLYKLARRGEEIERKPREVIIYETELLNFDIKTGRAEIRILCGKGTYIRSIAHDLGKLLGTHAHLFSLRRTKSGPYSVEKALTVPNLVSLFNADDDIDLS